MKARQLCISLILGLGLTLALLWLLGGSPPMARAQAPAGSKTYYVAPGRDCGSVTPCYASVQAAVEEASEGDIIKVAAGTYTDLNTDVVSGKTITQVVYISQAITICGGYTTNNWTTPYPITQPTTLDAQGQGRVVFITGNIHPTIEGMHITGGNAVGLGGGPKGEDSGGGVYALKAEATLSNNQVFSNTAVQGGGVYLHNSAATLSYNTIQANTANFGGGLYLTLISTATLSDNTFISNSAREAGGGLLLAEHSDATLNGNEFIANTASHRNGGGLHLAVSSTAIISGNTFITNTAGHNGGGLFLYDHSAATLSGNTFATNEARHGGGGLYVCERSSATLSGDTVISNTVDAANYGGGGGLALNQSSAVALTNTIIADNRLNGLPGIGAGLFIGGSSAHLLHTTIARNSGGDGSGVYVTEFTDPGKGIKGHSTVALTNTILVSHTVGITVTAGNTVTVNGVLWYSTPITVSQAPTVKVTVQNQHKGTPAFTPDGYHLTAGSEAIDQGVKAGVTTDIDGDDRPFDGNRDGVAEVDLGVDEFASAIEVIKEASATTAKVGDAITYTYTVKNTGDVLLTGVSADDDPLGPISLVITKLEPGQITTGTATHTVVAGDLVRRSLVNVVTVTGKSRFGDVVTDTDNATVKLPPCLCLPASGAVLLVLSSVVSRRKK
jgi:parallel beta-helix repeat protein